MGWPKNPVARLRTYFANSLPTIKSADMNALQDFALERTTPTIDKSMNGHKYIDLADGLSPGEAVHRGQFGGIVSGTTLGSAAYQVLPSGLIIRSGTVTVATGLIAAGGTSNVVVSYPNVFPTATLQVFLQGQWNSGLIFVLGLLSASAPTASGFTVAIYNADPSGASSTASGKINYLAVGV